jgi:4,5-DOPA dioxygenase extradiol
VSRAPALFVSHGAATLTTRAGDPLDLALRSAGSTLGSARAWVVVSAHDVRVETTIGVAPTLAMWNDHPAARGLAWQARGAMDVADALARLLSSAGIEARAGEPLLDHGAWVPLRALDPAATRPVVTLSLHEGLDPGFHSRLGRALTALRDDGVALLASGGLTHNQQEFRRGYLAGEHEATVAEPSARFDAWARAVLSTPGPARSEALLRASAHRDFAWCHPTLEHWLPLLVAAGSADGEPGVVLHRGYQHSLSTALVGFGL